MSKIIFDLPREYIYRPGQTIAGRVQTTSQLNVASLSVQLKGYLWTDIPWIGSNYKRQVVFLNVSVSILSGRFTVRAGQEWPFSIHIPARIDWEAVNQYLIRSTDRGLGVDDPLSLPSGLPPSVTDLTPGGMNIRYEVRVVGHAHNSSSLMADRWASHSVSSPVYQITVRPGRDVERPDSDVVQVVERFVLRSSKLVHIPGHSRSRSLSNRLSGYFLDKDPPTFHFRLHVTIGRVVVAGEKVLLKLVLRGDPQVSTGDPAPTVHLTELQMRVGSSTKILGPGRHVEGDEKVLFFIQDPRDTFGETETQFAVLEDPIELKMGQTIDLRDHISNLGPWTEETPTFETYGMSRKFTTSISGALSVVGRKFRFQLHTQLLKVMSPVFEPAPEYKPASYALIPPEEELPPTYGETESDPMTA